MDQFIQWFHRLRGHRQRYVSVSTMLFGGVEGGWLEYRCSCGRRWHG